MDIIERAMTRQITEIDFSDSNLTRETKAILSLTQKSKKMLFEIAVRLTEIKNKEYYKKDGFTTVFEYAEKVLGYKKNMCYKMFNVAEKFITVNGKNNYNSIIAHEDTDYTVSQLIELNTLKPEQVIQLDKTETITPEMTTKEIREIVKDTKQLEKQEETEESAGEEKDTETNAETDLSKDFSKYKKAITILNELVSTGNLEKLTAYTNTIIQNENAEKGEFKELIDTMMFDVSVLKIFNTIGDVKSYKDLQKKIKE